MVFLYIIYFLKILSGDEFSVNDSYPTKDIAIIEDKDYTNILKEVHDNLDTYIGQKISFTGYVYRVDDLQNNEFILARDMIINSKNQTIVVGFLCSYNKSADLSDGCWINITGTIEKGNYYGDIPIIKIDSLEKTQKPENPNVYPPDENYVPTSAIL